MFVTGLASDVIAELDEVGGKGVLPCSLSLSVGIQWMYMHLFHIVGKSVFIEYLLYIPFMLSVPLPLHTPLTPPPPSLPHRYPKVVPLLSSLSTA